MWGLPRPGSQGRGGLAWGWVGVEGCCCQAWTSRLTFVRVSLCHLQTTMPGMKRDCGGAAAVLGAFRAAIKQVSGALPTLGRGILGVPHGCSPLPCLSRHRHHHVPT